MADECVLNMLEINETGNCLYRTAIKNAASRLPFQSCNPGLAHPDIDSKHGHAVGFLIRANQPPALGLINWLYQAISQNHPAEHCLKAPFWAIPT